MLEHQERNLARTIVAGTEAALERARRNLKSKGGSRAIGQGQIFEIGGLNSEAAHEYIKALNDSDEETSCEAAARLIVVLLKTGQYEKALRHATSLASESPDFQIQSVILGETYSALTLLGDALAANGRLDNAAEIYEKALRKQPDDPYLSGRLALIHLSHGKLSEAIALRDNFADSGRFRDLVNTISLAESGLVRPSLSPADVVSVIQSNPAGRPFRVESMRRAKAIKRSGWS